MSQGGLPGQEILLYSEPGCIFGDITFAQVDGVWWGYFFSTSPGGTAAIKRVSLTGGPAAVLATVGANIDIVQQPSPTSSMMASISIGRMWTLVRKMPIRGGAITVLDQATPSTPTAGLALQDGNVIYASVADIRFVPTAGATSPPSARTIVTVSDRVTALHAVLQFVYWGEQNGAIRRDPDRFLPRRSRSDTGVRPDIDLDKRAGRCICAGVD